MRYVGRNTAFSYCLGDACAAWSPRTKADGLKSSSDTIPDTLKSRLARLGCRFGSEGPGAGLRAVTRGARRLELASHCERNNGVADESRVPNTIRTPRPERGPGPPQGLTGNALIAKVHLVWNGGCLKSYSTPPRSENGGQCAGLATRA